MISSIRSFFQKVSCFNRVKSANKVHSFTYYIPGPPERKTAYREKEFDQYFRKILAFQVEIISITTQTHNGGIHSGMWVILIVKSLTEKANTKLLELDDESIFSNTEAPLQNGPNIEGFYQINK